MPTAKPSSAAPRSASSVPASRQGFLTLVSVLIVGAIGLATAVGLLTLGIVSTRSGFAALQSAQAKALADACAEEGLQQVRDLSTFTGTSTLTLGQGSCTYTVTTQGGSVRTVTASGTVGTVVRRVQVVTSALSPLIVPSTWLETGDFF